MSFLGDVGIADQHRRSLDDNERRRDMEKLQLEAAEQQARTLKNRRVAMAAIYANLISQEEAAQRPPTPNYDPAASDEVGMQRMRDDVLGAIPMGAPEGHPQSHTPSAPRKQAAPARRASVASQRRGAVALPAVSGGQSFDSMANNDPAARFGFADGGEVTQEKFNGIYDDAKVVDHKLPSIFTDALSDTHPRGSMLGRTVGEIAQSVQALADGGMVYNGVVGLKSFKDGGSVLLHHMHEKMFKPKSAVNMRRGGNVRGPGTGTSDSIPALLSNGEYVLSADTVRAVGKENLDALQAQHHTPVR